MTSYRRDVPGIVPMEGAGPSPKPSFDRDEHYANRFAAELLMPRKEVRRRVDVGEAPED